MSKRQLIVRKNRFHQLGDAWVGLSSGAHSWFSRLLYLFRRPKRARPITRSRANPPGINSFAFTCSLVALHAKLAKQKDHLSADAFIEFRCLFPVGDEESQNLRTLFKLAWEDEESAASHIDRMMSCYPNRRDLFEQVLAGLARHMLADGKPRKSDLAWLNDVAAEFDIHRLHMRHIIKQAELPLEARPHTLLNLPKRADEAQIKLAYRAFIRKCHPDKSATAALPETRMASERLSRAGNLAYRKLAK